MSPLEARVAQVAQSMGSGDAGAEVGLAVAALGHQALPDRVAQGFGDGCDTGATPGQGQVMARQVAQKAARVGEHFGGEDEGLLPTGGGGGRQRVGIGQSAQGFIQRWFEPVCPPFGVCQRRVGAGGDGTGGKILLEQLVDKQYLITVRVQDLQGRPGLQNGLALLAQ